MSSPHVPPPARELSAAEHLLLLAAQQDLDRRRLADREFRRQLRESEQVPLFTPPRQTGSSKAAEHPALPKPLPAPRMKPASLPPPDLARLTDTTLEAAKPILGERVRPRARARSWVVYAALVRATYALIHARRQKEHATTYTWFTVLDLLVLDLLPAVTGLSHATCERALSDLRESGLIATRRWYTMGEFLNAETGELVEREVCGGVFVSVVLRPTFERRAFVHQGELPAAPRDLAADRKAGRTAWQIRQESEVRESSSQQREEFETTLLLQWALKTHHHPILCY